MYQSNRKFQASSIDGKVKRKITIKEERHDVTTFAANGQRESIPGLREAITDQEERCNVTNDGGYELVINGAKIVLYEILPNAKNVSGGR